MKRLLSILTLCALMLALTACGSGGTSGGASSGAAGSGGDISFDAVYQGILDAQENTDELILFPEEGADAIESLYPGLTALNTVRIQHACTLIEQGFTSVSDIASCCGYADPEYFSKVFRGKMGVSPGAYIHSQKAKHDTEKATG